MKVLITFLLIVTNNICFGQVSSLTTQQLRELTPQQVREVTLEQISELTPDQLRVLTPEQVNELSPQQRRIFSTEQFDALNFDRPSHSLLPPIAIVSIDAPASLYQPFSFRNIESTPLCCEGRICDASGLANKCSDLMGIAEIGEENRSIFGGIIASLAGANLTPDQIVDAHIQGTFDFCRGCLAPDSDALLASQASLLTAVKRKVAVELNQQVTRYQALSAPIFVMYKEEINSYARRVINGSFPPDAEMAPNFRTLVESFREEASKDGTDIDAFIQSKLTCQDRGLSSIATSFQNGPRDCNNAENTFNEIQSNISDDNFLNLLASDTKLVVSVLDVNISDMTDFLTQNLENKVSTLREICSSNIENRSEQYFLFLEGFIPEEFLPQLNSQTSSHERSEMLRLKFLYSNMQDITSREIATSSDFLCEAVSSPDSPFVTDDIDNLGTRLSDFTTSYLAGNSSETQSSLLFRELLLISARDCGENYENRARRILCYDSLDVIVGDEGEDGDEGEGIEVLNDLPPETLLAANVRACQSDNLEVGSVFERLHFEMSSTPLSGINEEIASSRSGLLSSASRATDVVNSVAAEESRRTGRPESEIIQRSLGLRDRRGGTNLASANIERDILGRRVDNSSSKSVTASSATRSPASSENTSSGNGGGSNSNQNAFDNVLNNLAGGSNNNRNTGDSYIPRIPDSGTVDSVLSEPRNRDLVNSVDRIAQDVSRSATGEINAAEAVKSALSSETIEFPATAGIDPSDSARLRREIEGLRSDIDRRSQGESAEERYDRKLAEVENRHSRELQEIRAQMTTNARALEAAPPVPTGSEVGIGSGEFAARGAAGQLLASNGAGDSRSASTTGVGGIDSINSSGLQIMSSDVIGALVSRPNASLRFQRVRNVRTNELDLGVLSGETLMAADIDDIEVNQNLEIVAVILAGTRIPFATLGEDSKIAITEHVRATRPEVFTIAQATEGRRQLEVEVAAITEGGRELSSEATIRLTNFRAAYDQVISKASQMRNDRTN